MKRSKSGKVIHRDDCPRARNAAHWTWAGDMSDAELFSRLPAYPWLSLGQCCFSEAAQEQARGIAGQATVPGEPEASS